jgi:hypothetical protein
MIRIRTGAARSGPGFRTVVTRYLSIFIGRRLELRWEWTTVAAVRLRKAAETYHGMKERARRALSEDAFDTLEWDLDDLWSEKGTTHDSASALILQRLKEHQCAA